MCVLQSFGTYFDDILRYFTYLQNAPEPGPYPVMVYFHGGGYTVSANIQYPGHFYAQRGVIMVIPNYRLGRMGMEMIAILG